MRTGKDVPACLCQTEDNDPKMMELTQRYTACARAAGAPGFSAKWALVNPKETSRLAGSHRALTMLHRGCKVHQADQLLGRSTGRLIGCGCRAFQDSLKAKAHDAYRWKVAKPSTSSQAELTCLGRKASFHRLDDVWRLSSLTCLRQGRAKLSPGTILHPLLSTAVDNTSVS